MFEQPFCGECGQIKDQCICIETGRIEDILFPQSDIDEVEAWDLTQELFKCATDSEQIDAAKLDGFPVDEIIADWENDRKVEREAEARMGGDNHYYPESEEETAARFIESLMEVKKPIIKMNDDEFWNEIKKFGLA